MSMCSEEIFALIKKIESKSITKDETLNEIARIEQKYSDEIAFPTYVHKETKSRWNKKYFENLIKLSKSGASSKNFLIHMSEVGEFLVKRQKLYYRIIIVAVIAFMSISMVFFYAKIR